MEKETIKAILGVALCIGFAIVIGLVVLPPINQQIGDYVCSKNGTISDVYYDTTMNKCVLTLCLTMPFKTDFSDCYYDIEGGVDAI